MGTPVGPVPDDQPIDVTVVLRPTAADDFRADPDDVAAVRAFAGRAGLDVAEVDEPARTVRLRGPAAAARTAFDTPLALYDSGGRAIRGREGDLGLPDELDDRVVAVLGLDERPAARPRFQPAASARQGLTALQVARAYDFPAATGEGQTIAIIELGGGFGQADLDTYFGGLDLPTPAVSAVGVQGAANVPGGDPDGADGEVLLDIEVAGAVAPGAAQVVYFAPNTDAGFLAAINAAAAATPRPAAISISWGGPESSWTAQAMRAYDQAFAAARAAGITVLAAAGDAGADDATDRLVADFPAGSPNVIACGGTKLTLDAAGARASEVVWNEAADSATGGGYSATFTRPAWQPAAVGRYRGLPDISGNADPQTGYRVVVDGQPTVVGGTSAVAPLLAGLVARLAQLTGAPVADLAAVAYANPAAFTDITAGDNQGYPARSGWDPASGLGSPVGTKLLTAVGGPTPPPTTPPPTTPPPTTPPPTIPPPTTPPTQTVDAADRALWSAVATWAGGTHTGANARAAKAVRAWAQAKSLA
ncbi:MULTISPECIES: S53 family peptidase [Frankia]|uniref:S53 family peptidase n=1 Tax=Frankia TaxID=1854 RepID=UPI000303772C|nr:MULTISPECIES: S53 family peptidase [Frankia]